ncbi:uncharacterized protein LOC132266805 [Cornus florida]|uniref:uncharacterized protein LOC132266805 n=1 Tax=Cornus florida TaxID=4283 RepID=UPI0028A24C1C|nr:uncharacterized protein LOC132266805 [Cornus florida]
MDVDAEESKAKSIAEDDAKDQVDVGGRCRITTSTVSQSMSLSGGTSDYRLDGIVIGGENQRLVLRRETGPSLYSVSNIALLINIVGAGTLDRDFLFNQVLDSYMDSQYKFDQGLDKSPTSILFGPNFLSSKLYQLSPPEVILFDAP